MFTRFGEGRRVDCGITNDDGILNLAQLNTGYMMRIADATEAMAKNYLKLQADLDMYTRLHQEKSASVSRLEKSNAALRGVITKLKKERAPKGEE